MPGSKAATPWKMDADSRLVLAWILYYIGLYWPLYTYIYKVLSSPLLSSLVWHFNMLVLVASCPASHLHAIFSMCFTNNPGWFLSSHWNYTWYRPWPGGLVIWLNYTKRNNRFGNVNNQQSTVTLFIIKHKMTVVFCNFPHLKVTGREGF